MILALSCAAALAEMGAAFLCAIADVANENTERSTTAYPQNWISKLEDDNRLVVHAAANAQRAVDSILSTYFEKPDIVDYDDWQSMPLASSQFLFLALVAPRRSQLIVWERPF